MSGVIEERKKAALTSARPPGAAPSAISAPSWAVPIISLANKSLSARSLAALESGGRFIGSDTRGPNKVGGNTVRGNKVGACVDHLYVLSAMTALWMPRISRPIGARMVRGRISAPAMGTLVRADNRNKRKQRAAGACTGIAHAVSASVV